MLWCHRRSYWWDYFRNILPLYISWKNLASTQKLSHNFYTTCSTNMQWTLFFFLYILNFAFYIKFFKFFLIVFHGIWVGSSDWISKPSYWWKRVRSTIMVIYANYISLDEQKLICFQARRDGIITNIFSICSVIPIQWSSMLLCKLTVLVLWIFQIFAKSSSCILHWPQLIHMFYCSMPIIHSIGRGRNCCCVKYKHKLD